MVHKCLNVYPCYTDRFKVRFMDIITILPMMVCKETACNLATPAKYGYIRVNSKEQAANFSLDSPKNELISFGISEK